MNETDRPMDSQGDPRVHFVMNAVLSLLFATVVLWGLDFLEIVSFTIVNVLTATIVVMALTYLVT
jgi:hypothetical protein